MTLAGLGEEIMKKIIFEKTTFDDAFMEHLKYCSRVVKSWPLWKRACLGTEHFTKKELEEYRSLK